MSDDGYETVRDGGRHCIVPLHATRIEHVRDVVPSIRLADESNEYEAVGVVAVKPTWRDVWAILRGTYQPMVTRRKAITTAGAAKVMKETWTDEKVRQVLDGPSPLAELLKRKDHGDV